MKGNAVEEKAPSSRTLLRERLELRRSEIQAAIATRVDGIADPGEVSDPEYARGLRRAISVALDRGLEAVGRGEAAAASVSPHLLDQARAAARAGVGLDTVLRRYLAGHVLLVDFIIEEAERCDVLTAGLLQEVLRGQAALVDRFQAAISKEYGLELDRRLRSSEQRRAEQIERLLAGEPVSTAGLAYEFEAHHVGLVASGPEAAEALEALAGKLDRRLLTVPRGEGTVWAWLGGFRPMDPGQIHELASESWPPGALLALGERGQGLDGWRVTHRQAIAAHLVAQRRPDRPTRYRDVALLVSALQDELLAASLHDLYLAPLAGEPDGGETLRRTLRAYFDTDRNISSTAARLGVSRNTVASRFRTIEKLLGRPLESCLVELDTALRLEELCQPPDNGLRRAGC